MIDVRAYLISISGLSCSLMTKYIDFNGKGEHSK